MTNAYWVHHVHDSYSTRVLTEGRRSCAPLTKRTATTLEVRWRNRWRRVYAEGFTSYFIDNDRFMVVERVLT
jgi:hypothetical protein